VASGQDALAAHELGLVPREPPRHDGNRLRVGVDECPNEAISEDDPIYIIDAEKCDDCATCVESCPSEAIVPE
jgi:MinD superfamily P-loop ATPase